MAGLPDDTAVQLQPYRIRIRSRFMFSVPLQLYMRRGTAGVVNSESSLHRGRSVWISLVRIL